jgi:hypothetical protein
VIGCLHEGWPDLADAIFGCLVDCTSTWAWPAWCTRDVSPRPGSRGATRGGVGGWARACAMLGATPRVTAPPFTPFPSPTSAPPPLRRERTRVWRPFVPFDALFSHPLRRESSRVGAIDRIYMLQCHRLSLFTVHFLLPLAGEEPVIPPSRPFSSC